MADEMPTDYEFKPWPIPDSTPTPAPPKGHICTEFDSSGACDQCGHQTAIRFLMNLRREDIVGGQLPRFDNLSREDYERVIVFAEQFAESELTRSRAALNVTNVEGLAKLIYESIFADGFDGTKGAERECYLNAARQVAGRYKPESAPSEGTKFIFPCGCQVIVWAIDSHQRHNVECCLFHTSAESSLELIKGVPMRLVHVGPDVRCMAALFPFACKLEAGHIGLHKDGSREWGS